MIGHEEKPEETYVSSGFFCALGGIRTHGLPFRRGTLYPTELQGHM